MASYFVVAAAAVAAANVEDTAADAVAFEVAAEAGLNAVVDVVAAGNSQKNATTAAAVVVGSPPKMSAAVD